MRIWTKGTHTYILRAVSAYSSDSQSFSVLSAPRLPNSVPAMTSARVRCRECDKVFTPRRLAQHASKSRNTRCRATHNSSHYQLATLPIPHALHQPRPYQISASGDSRDPSSGDEYDHASPSRQGSDSLSDLGGHLSPGAFIMTHVSEHDGVILRSDPFFYS